MHAANEKRDKELVEFEQKQNGIRAEQRAWKTSKTTILISDTLSRLEEGTVKMCIDVLPPTMFTNLHALFMTSQRAITDTRSLALSRSLLSLANSVEVGT